MLRFSRVDSGAQEIGFIYTSLLSVLLLASITTSVSGSQQGYPKLFLEQQSTGNADQDNRPLALQRWVSGQEFRTLS